MELHTLKTIFFTLTAVAIIEAAFNAWRYFCARKLWGPKVLPTQKGEKK